MFNSAVIKNIAVGNQNAFYALRSIEKALNERFWGMEDAILALLLSVACSEPLLLIGKPGTAKSLLIRAFCETVGLIAEGDYTKNGPLAEYLSRMDKEGGATGYFEYLLTPFTEPNELFGFYNIERLVKAGSEGSNGKLERIEKDVMQKAYVVYLDEVFNASSAILNSLLAFLNERIFHDRGERKPVLYKALFAATNRVPETGELAAVYDRFTLRCRLDNVKADERSIDKLLKKGWPETYGERRSAQGANAGRSTEGYQSLFDDLDHLHSDLSAHAQNDMIPNALSSNEKTQKFYHQFVTEINIARNGGLSEMSNRRVVKMMYVMVIHCMYRSINDPSNDTNFVLADPEIQLMRKFFYDQVYEPLVWK